MLDVHISNLFLCPAKSVGHGFEASKTRRSG
jgi:hypothetical protein